ncbi:MAG: transglycosylase SLT domain-containing protein [Betaproteobacteria bacterium]|nr:transglycosylase SLT domain-containing protein [Betaproteobacteria bacterium]
MEKHVLKHRYRGRGRAWLACAWVALSFAASADPEPPLLLGTAPPTPASNPQQKAAPDGPGLASPPPAPLPETAAPVSPEIPASPVELANPAEQTSTAQYVPEESVQDAEPVEPFDLWDRIRDGFSMEPLADDRLVNRQIAWFSARPDYVERTVERSRLYLYYIVEEVQRRGMPMEIALLPIVESAFNPHALSRSQASGMWQFIPSTGRLFGLQQNWWYDGRKDVIAATNSALDYLQKLYDEFGSWDLALAGYNCGEGKIRREIAYNQARGLPTDYQSLRLPDETRNYVPKLLAAKAIVLNPERYGLKLAPIPDEPYFAAVTTRKRLDTKLAAKFAEMSVDDFLMLNPGFNRPVISLDFNKEKTILVPAGVANRFVERLEDPNVKLVSWKTHHLRRGEPLEKVASQYGLSSEELKRINGIASNKKIAGGGVILVPDKPGTPKASLDLNGKPESEIPSPVPPQKSRHHKSSGHKSKAGNTAAHKKGTAHSRSHSKGTSHSKSTSRHTAKKSGKPKSP